ncbi:MAG: hypothetical protein ACJ749_02005 [Flavisolibacter sp.]|jgi:hypothetical protein
MPAEQSKLCPSATCSKGASLLGVVQKNKTVRLLETPIKLNEEFIQKAQEYGEPEKRFRFADKCVKNGCRQWTGSSCGVMNELSASNPSVKGDEEHLPDCFIRRSCRWYSQDGAKACKICLFVVTESREESDR